jgi:hypothetical protein
MVSCKESVSDLLTNRDDLRRRLDSKSVLADYVSCLYDCSSYLLANESAVKELMTCIADLLRKNNIARSEMKDSSSRPRKNVKLSDRGPFSASIDLFGNLLQILAKHVSQVCVIR